MRGPTTLKIFLSSGSTFTEEQASFVKAFEDFLLRNDCRPHTIGHNVYAANQPVLRARQEIKTCDGAIILAFTRYEIEKGREFPQSAKGKPIDGFRLPTVWNHLEGGMAYGLDLPLLILVEKGLKQQGILSDRSEWFPQQIELRAATLDEMAFKGIFADWKRMCEERAVERERRSHRTVAGLSMLELAQGIGVKTGINVVLALGSLLAAAFSAGYWVAQKLA